MAALAAAEALKARHGAEIKALRQQLRAEHERGVAKAVDAALKEQAEALGAERARAEGAGGGAEDVVADAAGGKRQRL